MLLNIHIGKDWNTPHSKPNLVVFVLMVKKVPFKKVKGLVINCFQTVYLAYVICRLRCWTSLLLSSSLIRVYIITPFISCNSFDIVCHHILSQMDRRRELNFSMQVKWKDILVKFIRRRQIKIQFLYLQFATLIFAI